MKKDTKYKKKLQIRERFSHLRGKKLVYGSGIIAREIICTLNDFKIIGVLERYKVEGNYDGIPVLHFNLQFMAPMVQS